MHVTGKPSDQAKIVYPRGGGGWWLNNLIYHLEQADWTLPGCQLLFDHTPRSSVVVCHAFDVADAAADRIVAHCLLDQALVFGTDKTFNIYLNFAGKVEYPQYVLGDRSIMEQFQQLTDDAVYFATDTTYRRYYCDRIDLHYQQIFQQPRQFAQRLFDLLDGLDIQYTKNTQYVIDSCANYRRTCWNPAHYTGRLDSLVWLAWCHAWVMRSGQQLSTYIGPDSTQAQICDIIGPYSTACALATQAEVFDWHD
jgi:hypothetical protein